MEVLTRIIDNNLCIAHFSLTYKEAMHIYQEAEENNDGDTNDVEESFLMKIEKEYLNEILLDRNLISIGEKEIRIISDLKNGQPFIGVARFIVLPEVINLALPMTLPLSLKKEYTNKVNNLKEEFVMRLYDNGYSTFSECDQIEKDCVVTYDLRFLIDGKIVSEYSDQTLEMYKNNEIDLEKFIGAKVNDAVIVSNVDGVITDFLIKKIEKSMPYNETTEIEKFLEIGYQNYLEMFESFSNSFCYITKVNLYIDYFVDFIYQNSDIEFNNQIIEFYKKREFFVYDKEYDLAQTKEEREEIIKKSYIFDLLLKMVELKGSKLAEVDEYLIEKDFKDYCLNEDYDEYDFKIYYFKNQIFEYLKQEKVID